MSFILSAASGGGTISMTAAGTISAGQPVIATAAGTAAQVGVTATGTAVVVQNNLTSSGGNVCAYMASQQVYLAVVGSTIKAGTYGVTGPVWGTAATFVGSVAITSSDHTLFVLTGTSTFVLVYRQTTTNYPTVVAGSVSGTTITLGTPVVIESVAYASLEISGCTVDATRFLVAYGNRLTSTAFRTFAGSVSGTTITLGSVTTTALPSGGTVYGMYAIWNPSVSRAIFSTSESVSGVGYYWVMMAASLSGTTLTYGTPSSFDGPQAYVTGIKSDAYDSQYGQSILWANRIAGVGTRVYAATVSGTAISLSYNVNDGGYASATITYNTSQNLIVFAANSASFSISNSGSAFTVNAAGTTMAGGSGQVVYDSTLNQAVRDSGSDFGVLKIGTTNLGTGNYVGIAQNAASIAGTVTINVLGSSASISNLTPGSNYGVLSVGGLAPVSSLTLGTYAGVATTNATLLLKG